MGSGGVPKPKGKDSKAGSSKTTPKDKIGKVNTSKTPVTTEQKKKEVKENIRKLQAILESSKSQHEEYKKGVQRITEAYSNGAHPEHKDEYERQTMELKRMTDTLENYEADLNELIAEQSDLENMDGVEVTGGGVPSTVSSGSTNSESGPDPASSGPATDDHASNNPPTDPPVINLVDEEGASKQPATDEDPEDAGLFTPEQNKVVTGRSDDGEVIAWKKQGYSKQVIIRYGPKNSPKYERSTKFKAGIPFDENTTQQFGPDHRFGDEKNKDKKYVRQWGDFKGFFAVVYNCRLEELKPRVTGEKRKYPRIELGTKWSINGVFHRVFEVPSSVKHIWPNPFDCEEYIYNTAVDHDQKYQAWLSGQREGRDASPTPSPQTNRLMPQAPQVTRIKTEEGENNGAPSTTTVTSEKERMLRYKQVWCDLEGLDPQKLNGRQKNAFLKDWDDVKDNP